MKKHYIKPVVKKRENLGAVAAASVEAPVPVASGNAQSEL